MPKYSQNRPLTDTAVKALKTSDKPYSRYDGIGYGGYAYVTKTGVTWRQFVVLNGKKVLLTIGHYPEMSLSDFRAECQKNKALADAGTDPRAGEEEGAGKSFKEASEDLIELLKTKLSPTSMEIVYNHFKYTAPLYNIPIKDLTRERIANFLKAMQNSQVARRVCLWIQRIFRYSIASGYVENDPTTYLQMILPPMSKKVHRPYTTDPKLLGDMLFKAQVKTQITYDSSYVVLFVAYTALRVNEAIRLVWSDVDFKNGTVSIPANRMKCRRPHTVYLSRQARALLERVRDLKLRVIKYPELIFQPRQANTVGMIDESTICLAVQKLSGIKSISTHGFRSSFSTICRDQQLGTSDAIELSLAHLLGNFTQQAYDHSTHEQERRELMQRWADWLDVQIKKASGRQSAGGEPQHNN